MRKIQGGANAPSCSPCERPCVWKEYSICYISTPCCKLLY